MYVMCLWTIFPKFSLIFKEQDSICKEIGFTELGGSVKLVGLQQSGLMGMEENCPTLIWPLENLRGAVRVIDCVWVGCSVSVENGSQKSNPRARSSPLRRGDIVFPLLSAAGWAGACMPKMPIITQSSQPICNYVVFADNDLPSASTAELILSINMPDGCNW